MKLKNPDLRTSFYFIRNRKKHYVFKLLVFCDYDETYDKFFYHLRCASVGRTLSLGMCFDTPEEAFISADRICSAYPPIESDNGSYHLEDYPEFCEEDIEDEH